MYIQTALLSIAALAGAKQVAKDQVKAAKLYDSGIRHVRTPQHCMFRHCIPKLGTDFMSSKTMSL